MTYQTQSAWPSQLAEQVKAAAIIAMTYSGYTPIKISNLNLPHLYMCLQTTIQF